MAWLLVLLALVVGCGVPPAAPLAYAAQSYSITLGSSGQGRPITALRIGNGPRKLVLVGNTHGAPEANTYQLTLQLSEYFRSRPELVPAAVSLYLIPTLNPDGLENGTRFNANGVDLNRNLNTNHDGCPENDWSPTVQGAYGVISDTGGAYPDSEIESRLIRDFLIDAAGAIFLHSNAGLVFPALCEHAPSIALAQVYAESSGYAYSRYWPQYQITGGMHDWAASVGIAAITPELVSGDLPEFEQNLAAVQAVLDQAEELLLLPQDQIENGVPVPALIWRFWKMHGGAARFGLPLDPPRTLGDVVQQYFERALIEWRPAAAMPQLVQPALIGRALTAGRGFVFADPGGPGRFFPETGQAVEGAFLDYWEQGGGIQVFGFPISEEIVEYGVDGQARVVQYFERARLDFYPEGLPDGSLVQPGPLGWYAWHRTLAQAPTSGYQPR